VKLAKWQGLGNDYLIVEEAALPNPLTPQTIGLLCDRHTGVGADGILLRGRPTGAVPGAVARMRVFNPDGGEPEMCGNGIRIFARYLARSGAVAEPEFVVETLAGAIRPRLLDDGTVRVDMGRARFSGPQIDPSRIAGGLRLDDGRPVCPTDDIVGSVLQVGGADYRFTFVDVGNPHCVILVDDPRTFDVTGVGAEVERHPLFPNRVNVEFVRIRSDGSVDMRVWERGVGETLACGTGATAVGAACVRMGLTVSPTRVGLPGGELTIEVEEQPGTREPDDGPGTEPRVFMTGPAEEVFSCSLSADLLRRLGWPAASND